MKFCAIFITLILAAAEGFRSNAFNNKAISKRQNSQLKMIEIEANSYTYAAMFLVTIIPSIAFVKFVGDQADSSRGNLSEKTKEKFVKQMMEQVHIYALLYFYHGLFLIIYSFNSLALTLHCLHQRKRH